MENINPNLERRVTSVQLTGKVEFRDWLMRFARHERLRPSTLTEHALAHLAKDRGFESPPER